MKQKIHHYFIPHKQNGFRPHILRTHSLSIFSLAVILTKVILTAFLFWSYSSPAAFAAITSHELIEFANQSRIENGIAPVTENYILDRAAMQKARDMLDRDYFNHEDPDGNAPWHWLKDNGYIYSYAGENLAMDFIKSEGVHNAWMNSESHRANILNSNYQEIGIGVLQGELDGEKTTVLVQFFGTTFASRESEITGLATPAEIGTPTYTEIAASGTQPQLQGEQVVATIKEAPQDDFLNQLIFYSKKFYWIILSVLVLSLLINILVRIKVQHKPVIVQTIIVLILIAGIISIQTHFLESIPEALRII